MTYHRRRKEAGTFAGRAPRLAHYAARTRISIEREHVSQIRDLQLENSRLRRLLTDLLLEKAKLEERLSLEGDQQRNGPV